PCGPVWCVTSVMPRIFFARSRTSSMDLATFTPPPLPRPPAWICAFTTQTLPPSFCATDTASSTDIAGSPRGVTTPNLRKSCLPWYSWMFMKLRGPGCEANAKPRFYPHLVMVGLVGRVDRLRALVPARVVTADDGFRRVQRVAAVDLEGPLLRVLQSLSGHR